MKTKIVVANWKMAPNTLEDAKRIWTTTNKSIEKTRNIKLVVCPPDIYLNNLLKNKRSSKIKFGAQDISAQSSYAHTGEIGAEMVRNVGAEYVLIGHSERREMGESNDLVAKKIKEALNNNLTPILCIGEKERDSDGEYLKFVKEEITSAIFSLKKKDLVGFIVAYEPIWAIDKSYTESMNATDIHETVLFIRKALNESFDKDIANSAKILYGGSVEPLNVEKIMSIGNVDGLLVGHSSLNAEDFGKILRIVDK